MEIPGDFDLAVRCTKGEEKVCVRFTVTASFNNYGILAKTM